MQITPNFMFSERESDTMTEIQWNRKNNPALHAQVTPSSHPDTRISRLNWTANLQS